MKHLILITALAACQPAMAGGPIITEEDGAPVAVERGMTPGEKVALVILGSIIIGLITGGSDSPCNGPDDTPEPPVGGC